MHTFILQDWTTIRGGNANQVITQSEADWVDLSPYQDVVFWISVADVTGAATLLLQTSPTEDDVFFAASSLVSPITMAGSGTPLIVPAFMTASTTPLARYVRWQLTGGSTTPWDATFRIVIAANSPGL